MAALGSFVLLATFVVASYALAACVAGGRRRSRALVDSGIGAFYLTAALMSVASAILVHAFVTGNYAIKYVQRYSDSAQPLVPGEFHGGRGFPAGGAQEHVQVVEFLQIQ